MEILVYLDDEDKMAWNAVVNMQEDIDFLTNSVRTKIPNKEEENKLCAMIAYQKDITSNYWCNMIKKYGVLRDKRLTMDISGEFIYSYGTLVRNR